MKKSAIVETVTTGKYARYIRSSVDATESTVDYRQIVLDNRSGSGQIPDKLISGAMAAEYGALYAELYNWSVADRNGVDYNLDKAFLACKSLLAYFGSGIGTGGERELRSFRDDVTRACSVDTPEAKEIKDKMRPIKKKMREIEEISTPEALETNGKYQSLSAQVDALQITLDDLKEAEQARSLERKPAKFKTFRKMVENWIADRINKRQMESIQPPAEKKTRKQRRAEKFGRSISSVAPAELIKVLSPEQKAELAKLMATPAEQAQPAEQVKTPA